MRPSWPLVLLLMHHHRAAALTAPMLTLRLPREGVHHALDEEGVYTEEGLARRIASRVDGLSSWETWYEPPWFLTNGHAHTIFAAKLRKSPGCVYRRELIPTPDGGTLALDVLCPDDEEHTGAARFVEGEKAERTNKFLLLLSGLGGGSEDTYVRSMAVDAQKSGWSVAVLNMRSCGGSPLTSPRFFSAHRGATDDLRCALDWAKEHLLLENARVGLVGWSNSGSITANALAEQAADGNIRVDVACALATPLNMPSCSANLEKFFHRQVYDRSIGTGLSLKFRQNRDIFLDNDVPRWEGVGGSYRPDLAMAASATSIRAIDEAITAPCFGFDTVDDYYASASCDNRLAAIQTPLLILNALDDPIAPLINTLKLREAIRTNHHLCLALTRHGGHLGWADSSSPTAPPQWAQRTALDFLDAALLETNTRP